MKISNLKAIVFIALSGVMMIGHSADDPNLKIPDDLLYAGKPIDSLCFDGGSENNKIDLKKCGAQNAKYTIKDSDTMLNQKGYIGYEWVGPSMPMDVRGYSYYRFYEAGNHRYWIYTINNGGGSGDFTELLLAQRLDPNTMAIQLIASGDRCNGGVQDVSLNNSMLTFSVNLTPYDLISLSHAKQTNLSAYDDLAACAVCCVAKAFYTVSVDQKPVFKYVSLEKFTNTSELPTQGKYQNCLNDLLISSIKDQKNLNQEKIDALALQFKKNCFSN